MNNLVLQDIPAMSQICIDQVKEIENKALQLPQLKIETSQLIHAGVYVRTVIIPKNVIITGALIKIATVLIIQGEAIIYVGNGTTILSGYNVLKASANRKQVILAKSNVYLTMMFATKCTNIEEAEKEFTDEYNLLITKNIEDNLCQV